MSKVRVEIDDSQVQAVFNALSIKKQKKVLKDGLRKSANILVRKARQLLAMKVKNTNKPNRWNGKSMKSGIKTVMENESTAKVHIMGDFRLKFFEKGTKPRRTKGKLRKSHSTGSISSSKFHFFDTAKGVSEKQVFDSLNENIKRSIENAILKGKNRFV